VTTGEAVVTAGQLAVTPGGKVHASESAVKTAQMEPAP